MRALTIDYALRDLREREIPEPEIRPDQILFRVVEVGICGTDRELAAFRFGHGPPGDSFLIPGHEALGEVVDAGAETHGFAPGDLVVPTVRRICVPACPSCSRRRSDLCISGRYTERGILGRHGYFTELAADCAEDLIRIPQTLRAVAVLIEPLSVVEKAVGTALRLHADEPKRALVLGAGTVGVLAAMTLKLRGLEVDLVSPEPTGSPRAGLAKLAGSRYLNILDRQADIVLEAAGAPEAANVGLQWLAPLGVMVVLGAFSTAGPVSLLSLITGNQIVTGSVNASPEAFRQAADDLQQFPAPVLSRLIERTSFIDYRRTFTGAAAGSLSPKVVHVMRSG